MRRLKQKNACGHLFSRKHGLGLPIQKQFSLVLINIDYYPIGTAYCLLPIPSFLASAAWQAEAGAGAERDAKPRGGQRHDACSAEELGKNRVVPGN